MFGSLYPNEISLKRLEYETGDALYAVDVPSLRILRKGNSKLRCVCIQLVLQTERAALRIISGKLLRRGSENVVALSTHRKSFIKFLDALRATVRILIML